MVGMRIEEAIEPSRGEIIDTMHRQRMLAGDKNKCNAGMGRVVRIVDACQKAADLVGIEEKPLVHGFAPAVGRRP